MRRYILFQNLALENAVKALLSAQGAYSTLDTPEGGLLERGLIREGGLFKKLDEKDLHDSIISFLLHILQIPHTI